MRGHVRKRGRVWCLVVDAGDQPAQRCEAAECQRRGPAGTVRPALFWTDGKDPKKECPKCGGPLVDVMLRRQRWASGFRTRAEAQKELNRILGELGRGGDPFPEAISIREYAEHYLKSADIRPLTRKRYQIMLVGHVLPTLGGLELAKVRPAHVQAILDEMRSKKLAPRTRAGVRALLFHLFKRVVKGGLVSANPVEATDRPKAERPNLTVPEHEQLRAIREAAIGTVWEIPALLSTTTGARRGETLAVQWKDLDLETGAIRIARALQRVDGELVFTEPKTARGRREFTLPPFAVERLRKHHREQAERRLRLGEAWCDVDLVSDRGDGGPLDPSAFSHGFHRIAKKAVLPASVRLHDLRHGVGTTLIAGGLDAATVAELLGHSDPGFTLRTYVHPTTRMAAKAAAVLEEALGD